MERQGSTDAQLSDPVVEFALRTFAFGLFLRPEVTGAEAEQADTPVQREEGSSGACLGLSEEYWEPLPTPAEITAAPGFTTLSCGRYCCLGITPEGDVHRWDAAGRGAGVLARGFGVEWSLSVLKDESGQRMQLRDIAIGCTPSTRSSAGADPPAGSISVVDVPLSPTPGSPESVGSNGSFASVTSPSKLAASVEAIALMDSGEVYTTPVWHSGATSDGTTPSACPNWQTILCLQSHLVVTVACGSGFCAALTAPGEIWTWGESDAGCLGQGEVVQRATQPLAVRGRLAGCRVAAIACGDRHVIAATFDEADNPGVVFAWGSNEHCRLGHAAGVMFSSAGGGTGGAPAVHAMAEPCLVPWITSTLGEQLYTRREGSSWDQRRPSLRRMPQRITQLGCGSRHSVVLCQGALICFGANDFGQLGRAGGSEHDARQDAGAVALELPDFASAPALTPSPDEDEFNTLPLAEQRVAARRRTQPTETAARRVCCGPLHTAVVSSDGSLHVLGLLAGLVDPEVPSSSGSATAALQGTLAATAQRLSSFGPQRPVVALTCGAHFIVASAEVALPAASEDAPGGAPALNVESITGGRDGAGGSMSSWRPANLPPKHEAESSRHRTMVRELQRNVRLRLEREQRQDQQRRVREERRERRLQEHTEIWLKQLLPNYAPGFPPTRRMARLWRQGLPPRVREVLWPMAIGNVLRITPELFEIHKQQALDARVAEAAAASNVLITLSDPPRSHGRERSIECIPFDLPRTFPTLAFFCEGGPLHNDCARILEAYTFFRPDIGYVQGMSYLAAVLLLYLPPYPAFVGLCNLLNSPSVLGLYRMEPRAVACRERVFQLLVTAQMPAVARVIEEAGLQPEMFLIEWFMTIYSKCLAIDVASVIWDLFLLDGEVVLYCTGLALLRICEQDLLEGGGADLEGCAHILGEELRDRASDPDELLWHVREVERLAPPQLLAEIRSIENTEFASTPRLPHSPSGSSSNSSTVPGTLGGGGPLQGPRALFSTWKETLVGRWR